MQGIESALSGINWEFWDPICKEVECNRELRGISESEVDPELERAMVLFETFAGNGGTMELRILLGLMVLDSVKDPIKFEARYALPLWAAIQSRAESENPYERFSTPTDAAVWKNTTGEFWSSLEQVNPGFTSETKELYESIMHLF